MFKSRKISSGATSRGKRAKILSGASLSFVSTVKKPGLKRFSKVKLSRTLTSAPPMIDLTESQVARMEEIHARGPRVTEAMRAEAAKWKLVTS